MQKNVNTLYFSIVSVIGLILFTIISRYSNILYSSVFGIVYILGLILTYYYLPYQINQEGFNQKYPQNMKDNSHPEHRLMPSYKFDNQSGYSGKNLFQVTPAKKCCLFPNSPECANISAEEIACVCCNNCNQKDPSLDGIPSRAFNGRPLHVDITPESDPSWKWTRCEKCKTSCSSAPLTPPVL